MCTCTHTTTCTNILPLERAVVTHSQGKAGEIHVEFLCHLPHLSHPASSPLWPDSIRRFRGIGYLADSVDKAEFLWGKVEGRFERVNEKCELWCIRSSVQPFWLACWAKGALGWSLNVAEFELHPKDMRMVNQFCSSGRNKISNLEQCFKKGFQGVSVRKGMWLTGTLNWEIKRVGAKAF